MLSFFLPGRNRKLHHALRLTALVLMISLMCPTVAPVCAAMADTEVSQIEILEAVIDIKRNFADIYRSVWREDRYNAKLKQAVNRAFRNQKEGKILEDLRLAFSSQDARDQFIEEVSELFDDEFATDYKIFIDELQKRFQNEYSKSLVEFFRNEVAKIVASLKDPLIQAEVRERCNKLLENSGAELSVRVTEAMRERYPGYISLGEGIPFIGGLMLYSCSEAIVSLIAGSSAGAAAAGITGSAVSGLLTKAATATIPVVGIGLMVWSVGKIGAKMLRTTDTMRGTFADEAVAFFSKEAPVVMWEEILGEKIEESFEDAAQMLQDILEEAEKHKADPAVQNYVQEQLKNRKDTDFYGKLAGITVELGIKLDEAFINDFAPVVLKTGVKQLPALSYIIDKNRIAAAQWFKLNPDDPQEILNFFRNPDTRDIIWEKYAPNAESLEDLRWIFQLSDKQQQKAIKLDQDDITWLRTDLPSRFVPRLFREDKDTVEIADEIERLHGILVRDDRRPWMDGFEFWITKYRIYLFIGIGAIALLFGLYAVLWIWKKIRALFPSKKKSDKKTDESDKKKEQSDKNTEQSDKKTEN